jgi:hypothetical protein
MREIKFRGKNYDGEWVHGYLVEMQDGTYICYDGQFNDDLFLSPKNIFTPVIPESVGQYTGLHDKSYKEIYEGDNTNRGTVEFWNGTFQVMKDGQCYDNLCWCYGELEVIGTIHDNPSLLEVQP